MQKETGAGSPSRIGERAKESLRGVLVCKAREGVAYRARIMLDGKRVSLGYFNSEAEASAAYVGAMAAIKLVKAQERKSSPPSQAQRKLVGAFYEAKRGKWSARLGPSSITGDRSVFVGYFDTPEQAHAAYKARLEFLRERAVRVDQETAVRALAVSLPGKVRTDAEIENAVMESKDHVTKRPRFRVMVTELGVPGPAQWHDSREAAIAEGRLLTKTNQVNIFA